nr:FISUMP domain-containing protein [Riemerella columbina]
MKKSILLLSVLAMGASLYAQEEGRVGINTDSPKATLDISRKEGLPASQVQGAILPHISMDERNQFKNVTEGTMIYNTTKHCIDWFDGTNWQCMASEPKMPSQTCEKLVKDRCYGKTTKECVGYGAEEREHDFIYCEITGPDGRKWLNFNLGAEYAREGSPDFNPTKPLTEIWKDDYKAYGSLFQWQRNPDGHELINWTSSTLKGEEIPPFKYTPNLDMIDYPKSWTNAGTNKFIRVDEQQLSWLDNKAFEQSSEFNLWQSGGATNPCPEGYHVPTKEELMKLRNAIEKSNLDEKQIVSFKMFEERSLALPFSGFMFTPTWGSAGEEGHLWSSEIKLEKYSNSPWNLDYNRYTSEILASSGDYYGFGVRCIKDL